MSISGKIREFKTYDEPIMISFIAGGKFDSVVRISLPVDKGLKVMKLANKLLQEKE